MRPLVLVLLGLVFGSAIASANGGGIDSGNIAPDEAWSYTFNEEMHFSYHCHPHPWMTGTVSVVATAERAPQNHTIFIVEPTTDVTTWGFDPPVLTIQANDVVTWINNGTVPHTVTQKEAGHGHDDPHDGHGDASDSPAAAPLLVVLLLGLVLAWARRR